MVRNGQVLYEPGAAGRRHTHVPIKNMLKTKERLHGVSHGLAEVGYDIRLKQNVNFYPKKKEVFVIQDIGRNSFQTFSGNFCITSAIEEFDMPHDLMGIVHDKSTWARKGLSVFNTCI